MASPYNLPINYDCVSCKLRNERVFCNLPDEEIKQLDSIKFTSAYPKGSVLFVEQQEPRGIYIVCSGKVKLTTSSAEGKTLILRIAEPGEVLGLSASILGSPYEVTAETLEPSQINFIKREDFARFMAGSTEVCFHTAQALSAKYHDAQKELRSLGLAQSATERLARLLLQWCAEQGAGKSKDGSIRLKVLLTHSEIAQLVGTTRETVTRLLSDFRRKEILQVKGSTFTVTDPAALQDLVTT
jgi:CRP/FNR family transcriptional regulator, cyclic AMP receptor protein